MKKLRYFFFRNYVLLAKRRHVTQLSFSFIYKPVLRETVVTADKQTVEYIGSGWWYCKEPIKPIEFKTFYL